jgi:hypothetical protein
VNLEGVHVAEIAFGLVDHLATPVSSSRCQTAWPASDRPCCGCVVACLHLHLGRTGPSPLFYLPWSILSVTDIDLTWIIA